MEATPKRDDMPLTYELTAAPSSLVTLASIKQHLYVDTNDDDDYLTILINVCERMVEDRTQLYIGTQTWKLYMDAFPTADSGLIQLMKSPVQSVTTISYTDSDGNAATVTNFQLDNISKPDRLLPAVDAVWPTTQTGLINALNIEFIAGFTTIEKLNNSYPYLVHAIKLLVGEYYENREAVQDIDLKKLPDGVDQLISLAGVHTYT